MKIAFSLIPIASLILAACATPSVQQEASLASKAICCRSMAEFQYAKLEDGKEVRFMLDESSMVYRFGESKSYFKAFQIDTAPNKMILVKSYFNGMLIGQFLQPVFQFLDSEYHPLTALTPRQRFVEGRLFGDHSAHMDGAVPVPQTAKYVVVHTAKFSVPPDTATTKPSINAFMIGNTPVVTQNAGKSIELERSPIGELLIEIRDIPKRL
jgi:hypothetical protein